MQEKHGIKKPKPFTCTRCGKAFSTKHSLKKHSMTHAGFSPLSCGLCSRSLKQRSNYIRHVNKLHNGACTCGRCKRGFESAKHYFDHQSDGVCLDQEPPHKESKAAGVSAKLGNRDVTVTNTNTPSHAAAALGVQVNAVSESAGALDVKSQFSDSLSSQVWQNEQPMFRGTALRSSRDVMLRVQPTASEPKDMTEVKGSDVSRHTEPPLIERGSPDGFALPAAAQSPSCLPEEMDGFELANMHLSAASEEEKSPRLRFEENIDGSIGNKLPITDDPLEYRSDDSAAPADSPRADVFADGSSYFGGSDGEVRDSDCKCGIYAKFVSGTGSSGCR